MKPILIAGIGNIFLGDDAFGVEAVRALVCRDLPPGVIVRDFGIRCLDLAFVLTQDWQAVIVLDAVGRGQPPGTLYRIELDLDSVPTQPLDAHTVSVAHVQSLARQMSLRLPPMLLIGCEPLQFDPVCGDGPMLSPSLAAALPRALAMTEAVIHDLLASQYEEVEA
ncbi:MAG: hydrogenase maturation protease [Terriglobales bacterium]